MIIHELREIIKELIKTKTDFPELFHDYDEYHSLVSTGNLKRANVIEEWIDKHSTILDVGIGDGLISKYLIDRRMVDVTGLDISNIACQKSREKGITVMVRDINTGLGLKDNELYDYILLIEVLEHIIYPHRLLSEAIHHARKAVIVTIPNSAYIKWRIQLLKGYFPKQSFTHLHHWSVKDFEMFCEILGISILDFKTFQYNSKLDRLLINSIRFKFRNLFASQQCWLLNSKI